MGDQRPTEEGERMGATNGKDQTVFRWDPAAIVPDSNGSLCLSVENTFISLNSPVIDDGIQESALLSKPCPNSPLFEGLLDIDGASLVDSCGSAQGAPRANTNVVF